MQFLEQSKVHKVPTKSITAIWWHIHPLVEKGLAHGNGEYKPTDVLRGLLKGHAQLWVSVREDYVEAIAITKLTQYPQQKICSIELVAGKDMKNWLDNLDLIYDWAKKSGCTAIEAQCRKGWKRILKDWHETKILMRKDL